MLQSSKVEYWEQSVLGHWLVLGTNMATCEGSSPFSPTKPIL